MTRKSLLQKVTGLVTIGLLTACSTSFKTPYIDVKVDGKGYITSIKEIDNGKEYSPKGKESALLSIAKDSVLYLPESFKFDSKSNEAVLEYPNGSKATISIKLVDNYLRMELLQLEPRNEINSIVWGPYNTNISKRIGDMIGVVRTDDFALGAYPIDLNTTGGNHLNDHGSPNYYYVHTPDSVKFPVPDSLKEGQRFRIGGDGISDVAFFSKPEEYFRMKTGVAAQLEPEFGSSFVMHSKDRTKSYEIFHTFMIGFDIKSPRHLRTQAVDEDFIGSAIAFYGCPDTLGLNVLENIVVNEGLEHMTLDGVWVRHPETIRNDMAWWGKHDSIASYALQLGLKSVQDEGLGEYYVNPADRWAGKEVSLKGKNQPITELTKELNAINVDYGLHTLCLFVQPHSSDVHPEVNNKLCTLFSTTIVKDLNLADTLIEVADTCYFNERGSWEDNRINALMLGKELITYDGVTTTKPYTLINAKRGAYNTTATAHAANSTASKLQVNCYLGFIPNLDMQDDYADFYAKLLIDGGMNYIDFDGMESCAYQGHGVYSYKRFFRTLFNKFREYGGKELRIMGAGVSEGTWLHMSTCNVGGGANVFCPIRNYWGIQGKDMRISSADSYFHPTFGIQNLRHDWGVQEIENLQAKAVAWDASFMLGLSENTVETHPDKAGIFKAFRVWENARKANVFSRQLKKEMQPKENRYHLEQVDDNTWKLYSVNEKGEMSEPITLSK